MQASATILFTREVPWESTLPVSTRMLADRFRVNGWEVLWVNPVRPGVLPAVDVARDERLVELRPRSPVPCSLRLVGGVERRHELAWQSVGPALRRALGPSTPAVLWLSHVKSHGIRTLFPGVPVVWHVTDDYAGMSRFPVAAARLLRAGLASAGHVACVSSELRDATVERYGVPVERTSVLPHGVDAGRIRERSGDDPLPGVTRPRLVYVGNTRRMDLATLDALSRREDVHLVVIGEREPLGAIASRPSVTALGPLAADRVGEVLPWCDAGWISYSPRELALARLGNPMKAVEYAAAGLPIFSPPLPAYRDLSVPVRLYEGLDQLLGLLSTLPPARAERALIRARVRDETWDQRFDAAVALVDRLRSVK